MKYEPIKAQKRACFRLAETGVEFLVFRTKRRMNIIIRNGYGPMGMKVREIRNGYGPMGRKVKEMMQKGVRGFNRQRWLVDAIYE